MQIEKHDKSYIVKLEDGSSWRIWPGDIALTLGWSPITVLEVSEIDDEFCSHALIDKTDGSRVRVRSTQGLARSASPAILEERLISASQGFQLSPVSYPRCWAARGDHFLSHEPMRPCVATLEENISEKFGRTQTYNAANRGVAIMAAIRLLLGDKILPATVATNTRIADTLVFAQFKCDQSIDIVLLL
ncbi:MAG: hypothetical protein WA716_24985 [Pseudolabrys sp.]